MSASSRAASSRICTNDWFNILLWVIGLHLAAVIFYFLYKRQNLVGPMISGKRQGAAGEAEMTHVPVWRLAIGAVIGRPSCRRCRSDFIILKKKTGWAE